MVTAWPLAKPGDAIAEVEQAITAEGLRGRIPPHHHDGQARTQAAPLHPPPAGRW